MIADRRGDVPPKRRGRIAGFAAVAGLVLGLCAPAAKAEPLVLTPQGMVQVALTLLDHGRPEQAMRFADALLRTNPADATALILKARAQRDMTQYTESVATARLAWRHATLPRERYGAALATAQGLASDGQRLRAQFWLRRALQAAPHDAARSLAERDLRYVRSRSRLALKFDLAVRPSSNVNGGTSEHIIEYFGLPLVVSPDSRALSGGTVQAAVTAQYRLAESQAAKTDLRLGLVNRTAWLSSSAQAAAPTARASDYRFSGVEIGLDQAWKLPAWKAEATASLSFGHNSYGGLPMSDYARLDLDLSRPVSAKLSAQTGLSLERQVRVDVPDRSATVVSATVGLTQRLESGDRLAFTLTTRHSQSDSISVDHNALQASLGWTMAKPLANVQISAGLDVEHRNYDNAPLSADGRTDLTLRGHASFAFQQLDYMGFVPVLSINADRTRSNLAINRSQSVGVGLSIKSAF